MKKNISILLSVVFLVSMVGCTSILSSSSNSNNKINIIASLFPQYDFAKQIVKDTAEVTLLLPPGTESHTFEPTPSDIIKISNADLFLYTGQYMEPWASTIADSIENKNLDIIDVSKGVVFQREGQILEEFACDCGDCDCGCCEEHDEHHEDAHHHEHHEHHEDAHHHEHEHMHGYDPHVWLNPGFADIMIDNITKAICDKDPDNKDFYQNNAQEYKQKLKQVNVQTRQVVDNAKRKTIVFGGRFAHLYFIKYYGLDYISAFDSCSAESEPSVQKLVSIIDFIKQNNIPCVYYEELSEPKVATSIAEQTHIKTLKFNTAHNVSKEQLENGITFLDILKENLENLKVGLN